MKTALLAFLLSLPLGAQSVIVKLFTARTTTGLSSFILNQGQTTHTLYAQYLNSGGTCTPSNSAGFLQIEASYDNSAYFGITAAPIGLSQIAGGYSGSISVSAGPFPYLRANLYVTPDANCAVTAYYSGGIYSVSQPQMLQAVTGQWRQALGTGATADRVIAGSASGLRAVLYALTIGNLNTTDTMSVTITENSSVCTAGLIQSYASYSIAGGQNLVIPGGPVPFATASRTASIICAHFSGSSLNYSISSIARVEQ